MFAYNFPGVWVAVSVTFYVQPFILVLSYYPVMLFN